MAYFGNQIKLLCGDATRRKYAMRIAEIIAATKTRTPDQLRVDSLKSNAERAARAVKAEKARQRLVRAQQAEREAKAVTPWLPTH